MDVKTLRDTIAPNRLYRFVYVIGTASGLGGVIFDSSPLREVSIICAGGVLIDTVARIREYLKH